MKKRNTTKTSELEEALSNELKADLQAARHSKGACTMQGYMVPKAVSKVGVKC